jgi:sugar/nucleoside kinase (ribokinase family)
MLLIVGEALVAFQRDVSVTPPRTRPPDPSGAPAISAYIAAKLGVPTAFVGGVGADDLGRLFCWTLYGAGVQPGTVAVATHLPTATAKIDYHADGSRSFEFHVTGTAATAITADRLGDWPERATWLHVSGSALQFGEPLASTVLAAVRRARAAEAVFSFDPNVRLEAMSPAAADNVAELLGQADYLFPSEGELEVLGGATEESLVGRGAIVCTTLGPAGCAVATPHERVELPASDGTVIDTDGAGDTFAAGFIAAVISGAKPVDAARVATGVAAKAIAVEGPMTVALAAADLAVRRNGSD